MTQYSHGKTAAANLALGFIMGAASLAATAGITKVQSTEEDKAHALERQST
jgi:hypothetical protein